MNIGGEINKIFEEASPKVEVLATNMLLDMQKLVSKNAEVIQFISEIISTMNERVTRLEELNYPHEAPEEIFKGTLKTLEDL